MRCSGSGKRDLEACSCNAQAVYEGAVIGQVFTGNVQMECPLSQREQLPQTPSTEGDARGGPFATAMQTVAVWHVWVSVSGADQMADADMCSTVAAVALAAAAHFVSPWRMLGRLRAGCARSKAGIERNGGGR